MPELLVFVLTTITSIVFLKAQLILWKIIQYVDKEHNVCARSGSGLLVCGSGLLSFHKKISCLHYLHMWAIWLVIPIKYNQLKSLNTSIRFTTSKVCTYLVSALNKFLNFFLISHLFSIPHIWQAYLVLVVLIVTYQTDKGKVLLHHVDFINRNLTLPIGHYKFKSPGSSSTTCLCVTWKPKYKDVLG